MVLNLGKRYEVAHGLSAFLPFGWLLQSTNSKKAALASFFEEFEGFPARP